MLLFSFVFTPFSFSYSRAILFFALVQNGRSKMCIRDSLSTADGGDQFFQLGDLADVGALINEAAHTTLEEDKKFIDIVKEVLS